MEHNNVWYAFNCDTGEVEKAGYEEDEIVEYAQDHDDCVWKKLDLNSVSEDGFRKIEHDGLTQKVQVREILDALSDETDDEVIGLDDDPTPDEEEAACKAYGLTKPE